MSRSLAALNQSTAGFDETDYLGKGSGRGRKSRGGREGRRRSSASLGRFLVLIIFFLLVATYGGGGFFALRFPAKYHMMIGICGAALIWVCALTLGVLYRQRWAQYILTALLMMSAVASIGGIAYLLERDPKPTPAVIGAVAAYGAIQALCAAVLAASRDVRRLTTNY